MFNIVYNQLCFQVLEEPKEDRSCGRGQILDNGWRCQSLNWCSTNSEAEKTLSSH